MATEVPSQGSISLVIPTYNGAARLPAALGHIAAQQVPAGIEWEVIVVDNASTDDTAAAARAAWPRQSPVPFRVIREERLGIRHAWAAGFAAARHELVAVIDDDNWVAADYVANAVAAMLRHPEAALCGARGEAECEIAPPAWFPRFQQAYAVGEQGSAGDITDSRGWIWSASMVMRRAAWLDLMASGYQPILVSREGDRLSSGGDVELSYALRLAGWRIRYQPQLRYRHYLEARRLNWRYLVALTAGGGEAEVIHALYRAQLAAPNAPPGWRATSRAWNIVLSFARLFRHPIKLFGSRAARFEGNADALYASFKWMRLRTLVARRYDLRESARRIRLAIGARY